jgi:Ca2+-transporting ATPase
MTLQRSPDVLAAGLTSEEVEARRRRFGPNTLPEPRPTPFWRIWVAQLRDLMVVVLLLAGTVAIVVGELVDVVVIAIIVLLNATLGALQEFRTARALAALRALAAPVARVRRDGVTRVVPAADLVPGDVVLLEAGNIVPADLRLAQVEQLQVTEALLTGESEPVRKSVAPPSSPSAAIGDRRDMAFLGTTITTGRAVGVVTAIAADTQLGQIAMMLRSEAEPRTPLQRRLDRLTRQLAIAAAALCGIVLVAGVLRREPLSLMIMTALSLGVAAIPEALPAVVTMTLAIGARRLAKRHALIRRLSAVETLGAVTVICVDKTGTLTENRMRVDAIVTRTGVVGDLAAVNDRRLLEAMAVSNDASIVSDQEATGDPTEVALVRFARTRGVDKERLVHELRRVAEIPFSPERARMTTVHQRSDGRLVGYTKGAPECLLPLCGGWASSAGDRADSAAFDRDQLIDAAQRMARDGLRVLAIATRELAALPVDVREAESGLALLALVGIVDPPRDDVREPIAMCRSAGIRVVMITGDHAATALAIARRIGLADDNATVLTGPQLHELGDEALATTAADAQVFARVSPADKLRIVKALQARGDVVAMTGDGANDAPALRYADIGVAMGRGGTDVAREAAALVLLDDRFATIVAAVRGGRRVYDNIRKFIEYVLSGNLGEVSTLLIAPLLGLPLPLLPIQILWVNLVTDGLPGLALSAEPAESDVMERPPREPSEALLAGGLWQRVLAMGLLIGAMTVATQALSLESRPREWRSLTFTMLTFAQMAFVLGVRSQHESVFRRGLFRNRPLTFAVLLTIGLQVAILYVPVLQRVFRTEPLPVVDLAIIAAGSALVLVVLELAKIIRRLRLARRAS